MVRFCSRSQASYAEPYREGGVDSARPTGYKSLIRPFHSWSNNMFILFLGQTRSSSINFLSHNGECRILFGVKLANANPDSLMVAL